MGKKSGPAAPTPPDPVATAAAQATANKESAVAQANLNRIDQYTPQGSLKYTQEGFNSDGTPKYSSTQTYSADEQAKYDNDNKIALALGGLANNNIGRVDDAQSQPFNYDSATPLQTGVSTGAPPINYGGSADPLQRNFNNGGNVQSSFNSGGPINRLNGSEGGNIQNNLDYSGAPQLAGANDFSAEAKRVQDSVYGQATSRLDPQFQQSESDIRAALANKGISENSDAYRRELDNFGRGKTDAYNQANYSSIKAGSDEQSRLFGLSLSARQQGVNETNTQGAFANDAQAQRLSQALNVTGQNNSATGQEFSQNQQQAAFGNQAQDQRYTQNLGSAEFANNATNQQFANNNTSASFGNTARGQAYNEGVSDLNINNAARQRQIEEQTYLRNLPLNEIAALLGTGGQVNNPNFTSVPQVGVAAPDYQGAVYQNFNAANQQYTAAQQARYFVLR